MSHIQAGSKIVRESSLAFNVHFLFISITVCKIEFPLYPICCLHATSCFQRPVTGGAIENAWRLQNISQWLAKRFSRPEMGIFLSCWNSKRNRPLWDRKVLKRKMSSLPQTQQLRSVQTYRRLMWSRNYICFMFPQLWYELIELLRQPGKFTA